jgi:hypothetical protein
VRAIVELLTDKSTTMLHLGGPDRVSRFEFGRAIAAAFGLDVAAIDAVRLADSDAVPKRPPGPVVRHGPRAELSASSAAIHRGSPGDDRSREPESGAIVSGRASGRSRRALLRAPVPVPC